SLQSVTQRSRSAGVSHLSVRRDGACQLRDSLAKDLRLPPQKGETAMKISRMLVAAGCAVVLLGTAPAAFAQRGGGGGHGGGGGGFHGGGMGGGFRGGGGAGSMMGHGGGFRGNPGPMI